jgi:hypothetical protein
MNDLTTANCNELSVGCRATLQEVGRGPVAVVSRCSVVVESSLCSVRWAAEMAGAFAPNGVGKN